MVFFDFTDQKKKKTRSRTLITKYLYWFHLKWTCQHVTFYSRLFEIKAFFFVDCYYISFLFYLTRFVAFYEAKFFVRPTFYIKLSLKRREQSTWATFFTFISTNNQHLTFIEIANFFFSLLLGWLYKLLSKKRLAQTYILFLIMKRKTTKKKVLVK